MTAELVTAFVERRLPHGSAEFEDFYSRYYPCVLGYAWKCFGAADAEDIAQETMARAFANFERLDPERDPWPWLCVVARRIGTDAVRQHARTVSVDDQRFADVPNPDSETAFERVLADDDRRTLRRALAELSPSDRRVLRLREYDDLSSSDIAALLDVSETAVRQQLFRARRRLAERFRAAGGMGAAVPLVLLRAVRTRLGRHVVRPGQGLGAAATGGALAIGTLAMIVGGVAEVRPSGAARTTTARTVPAVGRDDAAETRRSIAATSSRTATPDVPERQRPVARATEPHEATPVRIDWKHDMTGDWLSFRTGRRHSRVSVYVLDQHLLTVEQEGAQRGGAPAPLCTLVVVRCE